MKVLLLDTNVSSYPIYNYLLGLDYEVFVAGSNPNDCLALLSPNYLRFDYSLIDHVEHAIITHKIDYVIPGCNDVSYRSASIFNSKRNHGLNIDSPEVNQIINEKDFFKDFAQKIGLKVSKRIEKDQLFNSGLKKVIVKPTDSFSGRGITVLSESQFSSINDAISLAEKFSRNKSHIIEEFVEGQLYSHSAFIENGSIKFDFIVEEYCSTNPFTVDSSWVVPNKDFAHLKEIRFEIELLSNNLRLCDGLVHTQFIVNGKKIWILEVTRRCPGDLYSKLIEYSTGFKYSEVYVDQIFKKSYMKSFFPSYQSVLRHTLSFKNSMYFLSLKFKYDTKFLEFFPLMISGMDFSSKTKSKAGILFLTLYEFEDLADIKDMIDSQKFFSIE